MPTRWTILLDQLKCLAIFGGIVVPLSALAIRLWEYDVTSLLGGIAIALAGAVPAVTWLFGKWLREMTEALECLDEQMEELVESED